MPKSCPRSNCDRALQRVAVFPSDAHEIALNRCLHLQLAVLDRFHDVARLFDCDALLQRDFLLDARSRGGDDFAVAQTLERHVSLHQLGLENVDHRLELELVRAGEQDFVVLLLELDARFRILQIVTLLDLFHRLLHGVHHFRHFDFRDDVKTVVRHILLGVGRPGFGR